MIRLYVEGILNVEKSVVLTTAQEHYLRGVMRLRDGDTFIAFGNGEEFVAEMPGKIIEKTNRVDMANNAVLAFCPIKPSRLEEMISAATQMGVAKFQPVISKRVDIPKMNFDRFRKIAIEASEQCGRLSVPEFLPAVKFQELIKNVGKIYYGDERRVTIPSGDKAVDLPAGEEFTLLIGPEGGFAPEEFAALDDAGAIGISLGPLVLRAEVAAVAGLAKLLS
ncbi:MAG: 16S rRNA (uracil(1498)-N(3))-methyltransferase [Alphaproteobacteria bacterium]|nr:16S rRNA (uracil(1498)-N(3))-methyltransferase [Alphaproteobacteria bacterium]